MSNLRATADRLIEAQGQSVTLTRRAGGSYDPATSSATVSTSTQSGKAVIIPFSAGLRKMAGTNIPAGDVQCLLSALKSDGTALSAPHVDDTLTDSNAKVWSIVAVSPLEPAGTALIYDLVMRGAG